MGITTGMKKSQVAAVLDALAVEIPKALCEPGSAVFSIPGLLRIEKREIPARPARKDVPDPFKPGEVRSLSAQPARVRIKMRTLKDLHRMVSERELLS